MIVFGAPLRNPPAQGVGPVPKNHVQSQSDFVTDGLQPQKCALCVLLFSLKNEGLKEYLCGAGNGNKRQCKYLCDQLFSVP